MQGSDSEKEKTLSSLKSTTAGDGVGWGESAEVPLVTDQGGPRGARLRGQTARDKQTGASRTCVGVF